MSYNLSTGVLASVIAMVLLQLLFGTAPALAATPERPLHTHAMDECTIEQPASMSLLAVQGNQCDEVIHARDEAQATWEQLSKKKLALQSEQAERQTEIASGCPQDLSIISCVAGAVEQSHQEFADDIEQATTEADAAFERLMALNEAVGSCRSATLAGEPYTPPADLLTGGADGPIQGGVAETNEQRELRIRIESIDNQLPQLTHDVEQSAAELSEREREAEMKELAQCAYADKACELPANWKSATPEQLATLGLTNEDLNPKSGAHMEIFYDAERGSYTLAIRGSQGLKDFRPFSQWWKDWVQTNIAQGLGMESQQYNDVMAVGYTLATAVGPENLYVTGDSKAGGQAAAVHMLTGASAYTFDAAGLHENTVPRYQRQHGIEPPQYRGTITNIHATDDTLSRIQENTPIVRHVAPDAIGEQIVITPREGETVGHNITNLSPYLYERVDKAKREYDGHVQTLERLQDEKKQLIQQYNDAGARQYVTV